MKVLKTLNSRLKMETIATFVASLLTIAISVSVVDAQSMVGNRRNRWGWRGEFGPIKVNDSDIPAGNSEIAIFRNGSSIVVWEEEGNIKWKRFSNYGQVLDPVTQANTNSSPMTDPDVATSENNWFAIVWNQAGGVINCSPCQGKVWIRDYHPDGSPYSNTEVQVNSRDYMESPPFITAADTFPWPSIIQNVPWGVTWQPDEPTYNENVHFNSYPYGSDVRVDPYYLATPVGISVTSSGDEFIIFYKYSSSDESQIKARRVDTWSNLGTIYTFQIPATGDIHHSRATLNDIGQIGVVWIERDESGSEVLFQAYELTDDEILPIGDRKVVASTEKFVSDIAIAPYGWRFVVVWNEAEDYNNTLSEIYLRKMYAGFDSPHNPIWVDKDPYMRDTDPSLQVKGPYAYVSWTKSEVGQPYNDIYISKVYLGPELMGSLGNDKIGSLPETYALKQNHPNPFSMETEIRYELPQPSSYVRLVVYNSLGQEVQVLENSKKQAGYYTIRWDGRDNKGKRVSEGVYFIRMKADNFSSMRKMLILR